MSVCGGWSLVAHGTTGARAITMWCRSWQCPDCMPYRLSDLKRVASSGQPSTFLTLTVNPAIGESAEGRARALVDAMRVMLKRARRKFTKSPIEYLAVFEETKKGEPHLHMLLRAPFVPQKWISDTMDELIAAPIVDIRKVHSARLVARYVAKYVAKGPKSFGSLKRYWATRGYDLDTERKERKQSEKRAGWSPAQEPLFLIAEQWRNFQRQVVWLSPHEIFAPTGMDWRTPPIGAG